MFEIYVLLEVIDFPWSEAREARRRHPPAERVTAAGRRERSVLIPHNTENKA